MKIELLYFAQIRDAFGAAGEQLVVDEGATVDQVVSVLAGRDEWQKVASIPLSYAVNERIVNGDFALSDGDCLVLMTPISGG